MPKAFNNFAQTLNKRLQNCPRVSKFCQIDDTLANLVTPLTISSVFPDDGPGRLCGSRPAAERRQEAGVPPLQHRHHLPRMQRTQGPPKLPRGTIEHVGSHIPTYGIIPTCLSLSSSI